jgi:hypothetical protein
MMAYGIRKPFKIMIWNIAYILKDLILINLSNNDLKKETKKEKLKKKIV